MYLTSKAKEEIFKDNGSSEKDSGSAEGQVALFTARINHLTKHLKKNLLKMVGKRKSLLNYLKNKDIKRYRAIIKKLSLRK